MCPIQDGPADRLFGRAMSEAASPVLTGTIIEPLPNAMFAVELETGRRVLAHLGDEMRMPRVRLLPGDRVRVALSPYDLSRGRITARLHRDRGGERQ